MRWLILLAAVVSAMLAVQILFFERRHGRRRSTFGQLATALLGLMILMAGAYVAHWIGWFSLPVVAVAFVPFGLAARWSILATRDVRLRRETAVASQPRSRSQRLLELAAWPVFLTLVAFVVVAAIVATTLVGPH
jgi:Ca2+/Na+ antiporter